MHKMASTTSKLVGWLVVCLLVAIAVAFVKDFASIKPYPIETVGTFIVGAISALSIQSYALNAHARELREAVLKYWQPFSKPVAIIIPTTSEFIESSPFTPFQDALAASEIQSFLKEQIGVTPLVIAANDTPELDKSSSYNKIYIGGPKFNQETKKLMLGLANEELTSLFHWNFILREANNSSSLQEALKDSNISFLTRIEQQGKSLIPYDHIEDVRRAVTSPPINARGFVFWNKRTEENTSEMVIAGVSSAYGTLAAARYFMVPENLLKLKGNSRMQLITSAKVKGYEICDPSLIRSIEDGVS